MNKDDTSMKLSEIRLGKELYRSIADSGAKMGIFDGSPGKDLAENKGIGFTEKFKDGMLSRAPEVKDLELYKLAMDDQFIIQVVEDWVVDWHPPEMSELVNNFVYGLAPADIEKVFGGDGQALMNKLYSGTMDAKDVHRVIVLGLAFIVQDVFKTQLYYLYEEEGLTDIADKIRRSYDE